MKFSFGNQYLIPQKRMAALCCLAALLLCSTDSEPVAGFGSETTNGIYGIIVRADMDCSHPDSCKRDAFIVGLYAVDYHPRFDIGYRETTVTPDSFAFSPPEGGRYNLVIQDTLLNQGAFIPDIFADTMLKPIQLKTTRVIAGRGGAHGDQSDTLVQVSIPGTPFQTVADTAGDFFLSSLPPSTYRLHIEHTKSALDGYNFVRADTVNVDLTNNNGVPDTVVVSY